MRLKVIVPDHLVVDQPVTKIIAESVNGSFCLLPRHIDLATVLVPGVLSYYTSPSDVAHFLAIDEGILVKRQREVLISTFNAICSDNLETLKQTVAEQFGRLDEQEKLTRSALTKFEANIIRYFQEMGKS